MSGEQVKAYLYLLCSAWLEIPRASLNNDDNELAGLACLSLDKWLEIKTGILKAFILKEDNRYYSEKLFEVSEANKVFSEAGKRGGGNPNLIKGKVKPTVKGKVKPTVKLESESESDIEFNTETKENLLSLFENFRKKYPGTKRGNETEFTNFTKKHRDWKTILPTLLEKITKQIEHREILKSNNSFVPEWKNLSTWINKRCWEDEILIETPTCPEEIKVSIPKYENPVIPVQKTKAEIIVPTKKLPSVSLAGLL